MKKIYIANIGTEIGGIEKCLINFLKYLVEKDCEVDLALWKPNGPLYGEIPDFVNVLPSPGPGSLTQIRKEKNIPKWFVKIVKYVKFRIYNKLGCAWKSLPKNPKKYDIAISYCQNGYSPYYLIDNVAANKKYLWYHELNYIETDKKKATDFLYFEKYDNIICVSESCRNNLINAFPDLKEKFITLYNFYDFEEISTKANAESNPFERANKKVILTVGRLSEEKGVELAVNSCKELLKYTDDFVWYWVGSGPEKANAEMSVKRLNLTDKMFFLGNKTNPYPFMKNCDLYVQPSLSEAFCTTVIEAKVLKKPIVATNVDSIYEQISQTEYSVIVEKNPKEIASAISSVLNNNRGFDIEYDMHEINNKDKYDELFDWKKKH